MRSKDLELMESIKNYAEQYYLEHGCSPSTSKIASAMGIVKGTAYKYLVAMSDKRMITERAYMIQEDCCFSDFMHKNLFFCT